MDVTSTERAATEIELRRTYAARRETIFDAWTQAATLSRWFAPSDDFRTVVDRGAATELVLTHQRFAEQAQRDEHLKGWTGCLERLAAQL